MTQPAAAGAWRLRRFEVLGSTSDLCRTLAESGEPEGLALLAGRQTQGRGSRGRAWDSPAGNLSLSVLLRPCERLHLAGQWALLAGVALAEALGEWLPDPSALALKWPNDVLLNRSKLAGILLDSASDGQGGIEFLVIGMGANLAVAPPVRGRATAAMADIVSPPDPEDVALRVLARLDHWRGVRLREGFEPVRAAWLARAQPIDSPMTLKLADREIIGTFAGLGDDGSLLLESGGRVSAFATGDVLLPDAPAQ